MRKLPPILATLAAAALLATPLAAQLALPQVQVPDVGGTVGNVTATASDLDATVQREAEKLLRVRERAINSLIRKNRGAIEFDARGDLARRGELLATGVNAAERAALLDAGFTALATETLEGLDITVTRFAVPDRMPLKRAEFIASRLAPGADISPDNLHFQSGKQHLAAATALAPLAMQASASIRTEVGVIDGAPGSGVRVTGRKGFAKGALSASNHGSAVASLLQSAGVSRIRVADVYGTDPAGGNALAIAKGLGWLVASGSKVVTISLVGPKNSVVSKAIAAAQRKGVVVVAAVGNDGPAAPPAYPASYSGVVGVTGVDKRNRALIEAGRALNLDYAAPGADVYALDAKGKRKRWRGTSFATPLAAARIAAALDRGGAWRSRVDGEARDLGKKGIDATYGRGLVCGTCARK